MRLIDAEKVDFRSAFIGDSDFARDIRNSANEVLQSQATIKEEDILKKFVEYLCTFIEDDGILGCYHSEEERLSDIKNQINRALDLFNSEVK